MRWLFTSLGGFVGLAIKPVARWGQGVWGGKGAAAQTAPYIKESCRWAPMPGIEGRAKPD